jgi:uncharacterized protein (DUF1800 family)
MSRVAKHAKHRTVQLKVRTRRHRTHLPPNSLFAGSVTSLSQAMVDRLLWRAGFGPTAQDRATWTGRSLTDAVDHLLSTPQGAPLGAAPLRDGKALDPTNDDTDLVLAWLDQMVRNPNPFVERMTFFWHRHWANSRMSVSPPQLLITQNQLFRRFADYGANPAADFKSMAYAVSEDASMLRYLTGEYNVKGAPNENYARELMELFTLGVVDANGQPNYSQNDVTQAAKSLTGWTIDDTNPDSVKVNFDSNRWYNGPKTLFGQIRNYKERDVVDLVLGRPSHPSFLLTKLWGEFIAGPPDAATLSDLVATYKNGGFQLKPVLRKILTHPQLFASPSEPNLIKPPVVYVVGVMRTLGLTITDSRPVDYLDSMDQVPYFPPNVAGWEGGPAWLNTNTALARFSFVGDLIANAPAGSPAAVVDVPGETPDQAWSRAYAALGAPWLADGTKAAIQDYARRAPVKTSAQRVARQVMLRTLILAGPDGQVM